MRWKTLVDKYIDPIVLINYLIIKFDKCLQNKLYCYRPMCDYGVGKQEGINNMGCN